LPKLLAGTQKAVESATSSDDLIAIEDTSPALASLQKKAVQITVSIGPVHQRAVYKDGLLILNTHNINHIKL
jgi:hypothetical protein